MEMRAAGAAQGGLPVAASPGVASSRLTGITLGDLLDKGPEASRLSAEPPETSEKPLPPGFSEAEALASRDTAGEHPSG
ncbi:hypothetical protein KIN20_019110 [Parelaphostrongylus tenuis]|uniref:Uncharacterized protein n=1 Tax=Parelaphostrongylus tenuis TaxID=148309 RepID=A0AAD5QSL6_PARTN|nr:hypothetical protein KIN20_019110 [Parelaphostrongylus tenuis]